MLVMNLLKLTEIRLMRLVTLLQVNSETDFVAKNDQFRGLVKSLAAAALQTNLPVASGKHMAHEARLC